MLYLNSIENAEASPTEKKFAICHEEVSSMQNVPELAPSRELLAQWQSNTIDWDEFRERFTDEMRTEYSNGKESRLKRLAKRSLENDIALHSPEPSGEQTYRAILEEIINIIWKKEERTERVRNLAREPIEESQPQEDIARILEATLLELNLTKDDKTQLLRENDELNRDIQYLQTESHNKGKENDELKKRIDQLEEKINTHEATTDNLRQTLSEKQEIISKQKREIQLCDNAIGERDKETDKLKTQITQLREQIKNHTESIKTRDKLKTQITQLREQIKNHTESIKTRENKIQLLRAESYKKSRENDELKSQIDLLQDANAERRIKEIAVEAIENNSGIGQFFRNVSIDEHLPDTLRLRLMLSLKQALKISVFDKPKLGSLIKDYTDFGGTDLDKFDESDYYLAHVIRTQRNLIQYAKKAVDKKTMRGRILCCFFAAALLSPKLPELE